MVFKASAAYIKRLIDAQDKTRTGILIGATIAICIIYFAGYWQVIATILSVIYFSEKVSMWYTKGAKYYNTMKKKKKREVEKEARERKVH